MMKDNNKATFISFKKNSQIKGKKTTGKMA